MALINCPECDREVSSDAVTCPHCGIRISMTVIEGIHAVVSWLVVIGLVVIVALVLFIALG